MTATVVRAMVKDSRASASGGGSSEPGYLKAQAKTVRSRAGSSASFKDASMVPHLAEGRVVSCQKGLHALLRRLLTVEQRVFSQGRSSSQVDLCAPQVRSSAGGAKPGLPAPSRQPYRSRPSRATVAGSDETTASPRSNSSRVKTTTSLAIPHSAEGAEGLLFALVAWQRRIADRNEEVVVAVLIRFVTSM